MKDLCADIILGQDFQSKHESVTINQGGSKAPLVIGSFSTLNVNPPKLFEHLSTDCKPITTKSHKYSDAVHER